MDLRKWLGSLLPKAIGTASGVGHFPLGRAPDASFSMNVIIISLILTAGLIFAMGIAYIGLQGLLMLINPREANKNDTEDEV